MKQPLAGLAAASTLVAALAIGAAAPAQAAVPSEYRAALAQAQSYVRILDISKAGLFDQLTSDYGGQFPKKAANYALAHVKVNYKKEALAAAKSYRKILHLSNDGIYDQLTSPYGGQFTASQAEYAVAHLG